MNRYFFALLTALVLVNAPSHATSDWHTWGAVVATGPLGARTGNLEFWLEGQGRFNDDSSRFNQGIVRSALGYRVSPRAVVWGGYAYIPNDPMNQAENIVEHRIWQQLTWSAPEPVAGFSMSSRSRLEQRQIESANDVGWRARQLMKFTRPIGTHPNLYWSLWDELFVNLNDTDWGADGGLDQNRLFGGVGIKLTANAKTEIGYMHQWVKRDRRADAHNHILSLTVLLRF